MILLCRLINILCLLSLPHLTHQVDIVMEWWAGGIAYFDNWVTYRCDDIAPGTCCKPHPQLFASTMNDRRASGTAFHYLRQGQFGAGWPPRLGRSAGEWTVDCTGPPILRVYGPSNWPHYDDMEEYRPPWGDFEGNGPEEMVMGAAWIDLRLRFPASSAATRYLVFQGVKGLIWGKDTWNAASDGIPFPKVKRDKLNGHALQGKATISTPTRWVYPNMYTVNKTDFVNSGTGIYTSSDGRVLDLESL